MSDETVTDEDLESTAVRLSLAIRRMDYQRIKARESNSTNAHLTEARLNTLLAEAGVTLADLFLGIKDVQPCPTCGAENNIRCCEFGREPKT